jgi:plastocyanin
MKPFLLALLVAVGVAGCGASKSSSSNPAPAAQAPASPKTTAATSSGGTVAISMQNIAFSPGSATAKVGQKVVWTNKDTVEHNVTAKSGASFQSNNFGQDGTYEFTPTKAGTIKYTCTLHPGMDGTLTVTG